MSRVRLYLRIAKTEKGHKAAISVRKPNYAPLTEGWNERPAPTLAFAVVFDIPDERFNYARDVLAELTVDPESAEIAAELEPASHLDGEPGE